MKISSFDIFDTCLVRTCGKPQNVIFALAYDILGADADYVLVRDFVRKRFRAEYELWQEGVEAATIDQIYEKLDYSYYTSVPNERIKEREMFLESEILVPVKDVVEKIDECRKKGRVIFISDMYFPSSFLRSILKKYDIIKDNENLYVSCEYQSSKHTGRLYDIVKEKEHVSVKNWTHYGDDQNNDYLVPKKKGIKAIRVCHKSLEYEKLCEDLSPYMSNKIAASVFAGIMRATRLSLGLKNGEAIIANIICGFFIPFVSACLKDAQERHIKRLYFASRDAYVFYLVAKQLSSLFPEIELKYLYLSTRTVNPIIIENGSVEELRNILIKIYLFKPKTVLEMLGLCTKEINAIGKEINIEDICIYGDAVSERLLEILVHNYSKRIKANSKEKRELLLKYLRQEGFLCDDNLNVGLVDIGYNGTTQYCLSNYLSKSVMYYYWGVVNNNYYEDEMGCYKAFLYTDIIGISHPKFVESYLCKNLEGTVLGYEETKDGLVIVKNADSNNSRSEVEDFGFRKSILETAALMFLRFSCLTNAPEELLNNYSCRLIKNVSDYPSKELASFLANKIVWNHYIDGLSLIHKIYPHQYLINKLKHLSYKDNIIRFSYIWREACYSLSYGRWSINVIKTIKKAYKRLIYAVKST